MRIKQNQYPETDGLYVKVDGAYQEVAEGYTKIDGVWVPWDLDPSGDVDLGQAIANKRLDGLILKLMRTA